MILRRGLAVDGIEIARRLRLSKLAMRQAGAGSAHFRVRARQPRFLGGRCSVVATPRSEREAAALVIADADWYAHTRAAATEFDLGAQFLAGRPSTSRCAT